MSRVLESGRRAGRRAVKLVCTFEHDGKARRCRVADLSPLGVRLESIRPLPVGSRKRVSIELPDGSAVEGLAEVMWCSGGSMGVELMDVSEADRERIASAIAEAPAAPGRPHPDLDFTDDS